MSAENQTLQSLYQMVGFKPTARLHLILEAALNQASRISGEDALATAPFLILGTLFAGRHLAKDTDFATAFYTAFGSDETDKIAKRLSQFSPITAHSGPAEGIPVVSSEFLAILENAASSNREKIPDAISPEEIVITLLERRSDECQVLFDRDIDTWATLTTAVQKAFEGLSLAPSLHNRLRLLNEATDDASRLPLDKYRRSPRPPSSSIDEWAHYLGDRYGKKFTDRAVRTVVAAVEAASDQPRRTNNLVTVTSKFLLPALTAEYSPLSTLHLEKDAEGKIGTPPWHEPQAHTEESAEARMVYGETRPSVAFVSILETAASLTVTTRGFHEVTEWHLAFAAISSSANELKWQLHVQKSSLHAATVVLRRHLRNNQPKLEPLFNWSDLEDDNEPYAEEGLNDVLSKIESWEQAFTEFRSPKDFDWDSDVLDVFLLIESRWNEYSTNSKAYERLAASFQPQLTPRTLFLAYLLYAIELREESQPLPDGTDYFPIEILDASGKTTKEIEEMFFSEFFRKDQVSDAPAADRYDSNSLMATMRRANEFRIATGSDPNVGTRHIVASLLHPHGEDGTGSQVVFPDDGIPVEKLVDALESTITSNARPPSHDELKNWEPLLNRLHKGLVATNSGGSGGTKAEYTRDSMGHEIGGQSKDYARAIASTFLSSGDGDFCFALFGQWGRGKTTLIQQVSTELRKSYTTVTFNAWKFPSRPEVWVWLYESLKKEAAGDRLVNKLRLGIQTNLRADFGLPLIVPALLLLFTSIPKGSLLGWTIPVNGVSSVVAIALVILYGRRVWSGFGTTLADYLKLPNHGKHLGLQAAVGDDLKRLLATWAGSPIKPAKNKATDDESPSNSLPKDQPKPIKFFPPWNREELPLPKNKVAHIRHLIHAHWGLSVAFILFWFSLAIVIWRIHSHTTLSFSLVLAAFGVASIVSFFAILLPIQRSKTVLLVVDDLDRCPPKEMLAVIESLRVFLDDPEISAKLKIAMLLDREILAHAICDKYDELLPKPQTSAEESTKKASRFTKDSIVSEQIEKYFLLSFDLPALVSKDARDIAEKIVGRRSINKPLSSTRPARFSQAGGTSLSVDNAETEEPPTSKPSIGNPDGAEPMKSDVKTPSDDTSAGKGYPSEYEREADPKELVNEVHLNTAEQEEMVKILHSHLTTDSDHATPRLMRVTKMRYFLARQILRELKISFTPTELLKHFSTLPISRNYDSRIAQVVEMVTGNTPKQ